ncbi:MAG TPA: hypothetical protein VFU94_13525 [Conexibacter sp.]|nr:hypothetical protein [Conexibacter sp.]
MPDGRAYELVSPPDKNGGDVAADSSRTRAASNGGAVQFSSLGVFAGIQGTGISNDYISVRAADSNPGTNGWATHGLFPKMRALSVGALFGQVEPLYTGSFSPDFQRGLLYAWDSLDGNPFVGGVQNLYRNDGLLSSHGTYDLVSSCPLCASTSTPLPGLPDNETATNLRPTLAAASPDLDHAAFESEEQLTADTPAQPAGCDITTQPTTACHAHVYQWDDGRLTLAGRVPVLPATECDDANGPACVPADVSLAGEGTGVSRNASSSRTPNTISDGSDGHVRVFFTQPTDGSGQTSDQAGNPDAINTAYSGRLFMRVDGTSTVQLNVSERSTPDSYVPAQYLGASVDGSRVFFRTTEALTNDAPVDGRKIYMYDTTKPASAPDNLTLISVDHEPSDQGDVEAMIGVSDDGRYVYFTAAGQLVAGRPVLGSGRGIYVWHDGSLAYVGRAPILSALSEIATNNVNWALALGQARVTPDGRHLLFSTNNGAGLTGYDQGACQSQLGTGCRELYVYSADSGDLECASCNPTGAPATAMAADSVREHGGAAAMDFNLNRAISDDGSRVFFTTAEALVPQDVNGRKDAYEWTAGGTHGCQLPHGCIALISRGTSTDDSYYLDSSASGDDVFFSTRDQLVGWDRDGNYDLYDARVGGGFPEPPGSTECSGDQCQGELAGGSLLAPPPTSAFSGAGNVSQKLRARKKAPLRCKRGYVRKRVRGKVKCVRRKAKRKPGSKSTRSVHRAAVRATRAQHAEGRRS